MHYKKIPSRQPGWKIFTNRVCILLSLWLFYGLLYLVRTFQCQTRDLFYRTQKPPLVGSAGPKLRHCLLSKNISDSMPRLCRFCLAAPVPLACPCAFLTTRLYARIRNICDFCLYAGEGTNRQLQNTPDCFQWVYIN